MNDIEKAKELLKNGKYTCVLCKGDAVYTSTLRGVAPMVEWISSGTDLNGFSAADKIVGKASAMLFVLAGVKEVYAPVMSEGAINTLSHHGIRCFCDTHTDGIINRTATGSCPMEQAIKEIQEPSAAFEAIKCTQKLLKMQTKANAEAGVPFPEKEESISTNFIR